MVSGEIPDMLAQIATVICAAAMALSLSIEAHSFFHGRQASTTRSASATPRALEASPPSSHAPADPSG